MIIIGLTGGIGAGKTTVSKLFALLNIPIYIADDRAKRILDIDGEVQNKIKTLFGENSIVNGTVNRKLIAIESFGHPKILEQLNAIIHPAVSTDFEKWKADNNSAPYVVKEAAILFESGSHVGCDKIILVSAPLETRIDRVMKRDAITKSEVESRIINQWVEDKKKALSDFIIRNDEENSLISQVMRIHKKILNENS